jgi:uncharacterized protein YndB with AHSA1/START domain
MWHNLHMAQPPISDDSVKRATGRDWAEWGRLLDAEGAAAMPHNQIAQIVHDKFRAGDWWSQMVTVGYERLRGLRMAHQKGGTFEISKTKTIAAPLARVYTAWRSDAIRKKWLAHPDVAFSVAHANKALRFAWVDGTTRAAVAFVDRNGKTSVTVTHHKLRDAKAAEKMKRYWGAQLNALADHFGAV